MCTAGVCDLGIFAAGNKIDVSQCTYPQRAAPEGGPPITAPAYCAKTMTGH
jgi:hypothetical protein